jgi:hypothetical protein
MDIIRKLTLNGYCTVTLIIYLEVHNSKENGIKFQNFFILKAIRSSLENPKNAENNGITT